jgi:hypothetical protein
VIHKRLDSERRRARQHAAMRGPLAALWTRTGRRLVPAPHLLRLIHGGDDAGASE